MMSSFMRAGLVCGEGVSSYLSVYIIDDGKGFDPCFIIDRSVGLGVVMIDERAESVGGYARIRSAIGAGTQVLIAVPLMIQERI